MQGRAHCAPIHVKVVGLVVGAERTKTSDPAAAQVAKRGSDEGDPLGATLLYPSTHGEACGGGVSMSKTVMSTRAHKQDRAILRHGIVCVLKSTRGAPRASVHLAGAPPAFSRRRCAAGVHPAVSSGVTGEVCADSGRDSRPRDNVCSATPHSASTTLLETALAAQQSAHTRAKSICEGMNMPAQGAEARRGVYMPMGNTISVPLER